MPTSFAIKQVWYLVDKRGSVWLLRIGSVEVVEMIDKKLKRGTTLLSAEGGYTRQNRS